MQRKRTSPPQEVSQVFKTLGLHDANLRRQLLQFSRDLYSPPSLSNSEVILHTRNSTAANLREDRA